MAIGAQMYTLREHCGTVADIAASLKRVKQMGYDGVQGSAAGWGTFDTDELKRIKAALDEHGLACAATHEGLHKYDQAKHKQVVEKMNILDCKYTAIGGWSPSDEDGWTAAAWSKFAKQLDELADWYGEHDIRIGYHNHSREFSPLDDGRVPMQVLLDECSEAVWFEIDVYWVAHGLADPAAWVRKCAGRIPCLHYKDGFVTRKQEQKMSEVGNGNLNWDAINVACKEAGVEWYLVERDNGDLDPFDSLEISVKNMRAMGL